VLNVTPDSFSDGGRFLAPDAALRHAEQMVREGADILDIGAESTRPGATPVPESVELERLLPVVEAVRQRFACPISVDTSKPPVMSAAVAAGASMINDVYALRAPGAVKTVRALGVPVCLMHMQGEPRTMQQEPRYADVVAEVVAFLAERAAVCRAAGIPAAAILLDPGFGFGKRLDHNLALLRDLERIVALGYPVLVGLSRKSLIGTILGQPVEQRLHGSVALAAVAALKGARIVRAHDVGPTAEALRVVDAVMAGSMVRSTHG
jgi:dihydropteroate synthase